MCVYFSLLQSLNNKESAEPRWRSGSQGRGSRGGRGNFSPRYTAPGKQKFWNKNLLRLLFFKYCQASEIMSWLCCMNFCLFQPCTNLVPDQWTSCQFLFCTCFLIPGPCVLLSFVSDAVSITSLCGADMVVVDLLLSLYLCNSLSLIYEMVMIAVLDFNIFFLHHCQQLCLL